MKYILSALVSVLWLSIISIGVAFLFIWLLPHCFYSAWWKVLILVIFGTSVFKWIWNSIVPYLAVVPICYIGDKLAAWKTSCVSAAIPPGVIGVLCIMDFWIISRGIPFDAKDWIFAVVWNYVVASCYFHIALAFITRYNDAPNSDQYKIRENAA